MATVDLATKLGAGTHQSRAGNVKVPYLYEVTIDLADATIGASDVVQALDLPDDSMVLGAGIEVLTELTGTTADATITVQVNSQAYSAALDADAAAVGAYSVPNALTPLITTAADTVDLVFNAFTGTVTGGSFRVFAVVVDLTDAVKPGLVALGS